MPSTAKVPELVSFDSMASFDAVVQADRSPVSKPSAKSGRAAAGVVAEAGALRAEMLPETSRARTTYWWLVDASTVASV